MGVFWLVQEEVAPMKIGEKMGLFSVLSVFVSSL